MAGYLNMHNLSSRGIATIKVRNNTFGKAGKIEDP